VDSADNSLGDAEGEIATAGSAVTVADAHHIWLILKDCANFVCAPAPQIGDLLHGIVPVELYSEVFVFGLRKVRQGSPACFF
jgi:hypothetical protein